MKTYLGPEHAFSIPAADRAIWDEYELRRVGLVEHAAWVDFGTIKYEESATIRVEGCALPARFWRFTIQPLIEDVHAIVLETGSGNLSDYWPSVLLFASGMIVAK